MSGNMKLEDMSPTQRPTVAVVSSLGAWLLTMGCVAAAPEPSEPITPPAPSVVEGLFPAAPERLPTADDHSAEALLRGTTADGVLSESEIARARGCLDHLYPPVHTAPPLASDQPEGPVGGPPTGEEINRYRRSTAPRAEPPSVLLWLTPDAEAHLRANQDFAARSALAVRGRIGLPAVDAILEALRAERVSSMAKGEDGFYPWVRVDLPWNTDPWGASWNLLNLADVRDATMIGSPGPLSSRVVLRVDEAGWHLITEHGSGDCMSGCIHKEFRTYTCSATGDALVAEGPDGADGVVPRYFYPERPSLQPYADLDALLTAAASPSPWRALHAITVMDAALWSATPAVNEDFPIGARWASVHDAANARPPEVAAAWVAALRTHHPVIRRAAWTNLVRWRGDFVDPDAPDWEAWAASPPPLSPTSKDPFQHLEDW